MADVSKIPIQTVAGILAGLMGALGCAEADLLADNKYTCQVNADCAPGFLCLDDICRDGFQHAGTACEPCLLAECKGELSDCTESTKCSYIYACLAECDLDQPDCRVACEKRFPASVGDPAYQALKGCRRQQCFGVCIGNGGMFPELGEVCESCIMETCAEELNTCLRPTDLPEGELIGDCERFVRCQIGATSPSPVAFEECKQNNADSVNHGLLYYCRVASCPTECNVGRNWACVGTYSWPEPPFEEVTLGVRYYDFQLGGAASVAGGTVTAHETCTPEAPAFFSAMTNADGQVSLPLAEVGRRLDGCIRFAKEGYLTTKSERNKPWQYPFVDEPPFGWPAVPEVLVPDIEMLLGLTYDPTRGVVAVQIRDCFEHFGLRLQMKLVVDEETIDPFYVKDGIPFPGLDSSPDGQAYFLNVPEGFADITVVDEVAGVVASHTVIVEAATVHDVRLWPNTYEQVR